jgi:hypothetical protein
MAIPRCSLVVAAVRFAHSLKRSVAVCWFPLLQSVLKVAGSLIGSKMFSNLPTAPNA